MWEILRHLLRKHETIQKEVDQMMVSSRLGPLPSEIRAEYERKLAASEARFAEQQAASEARFAEQQAASEARFAEQRAASEAKLEQLTEQKAADEAVIAALKAQLLAAGIQPQTAA